MKIYYYNEHFYMKDGSYWYKKYIGSDIECAWELDKNITDNTAESIMTPVKSYDKILKWLGNKLFTLSNVIQVIIIIVISPIVVGTMAPFVVVRWFINAKKKFKTHSVFKLIYEDITS